LPTSFIAPNIKSKLDFMMTAFAKKIWFADKGFSAADKQMSFLFEAAVPHTAKLRAFWNRRQRLYPPPKVIDYHPRDHSSFWRPPRRSSAA
jgi:hypothetical protein